MTFTIPEPDKRGFKMSPENRQIQYVWNLEGENRVTMTVTHLPGYKEMFATVRPGKETAAGVRTFWLMDGVRLPERKITRYSVKQLREYAVDSLIALRAMAADNPRIQEMFA